VARLKIPRSAENCGPSHWTIGQWAIGLSDYGLNGLGLVW